MTDNTQRKQRLLKRFRRRKRVALWIILLLLVLDYIFISIWWLPLTLLALWIVHEAWFADHQFYSSRDDYRYDFPSFVRSFQVNLDKQDSLHFTTLPSGETLVLTLMVKATWLGRLFDPKVIIRTAKGERLDCQTFERGTRGRRYLNLSGCRRSLLEEGVTLHGRYCRVRGKGRLFVFDQPDFSRRRLMVIAPHADDAELAAFGLYSRSEDVSIVTLTQGEVEAGHYRRFGLDPSSAATLKGRLRSWDSQAIPLWGNVPVDRCVQLGYYCLQLTPMRDHPDREYASRDSGESDIRMVRGHNSIRLPGDIDGRPVWGNLVADLQACLDHFQPEVLICPHPELDPHSDHVAAFDALRTALQQSAWQPEYLLLYANHLSDNDRWPMGATGEGIALPPAFAPMTPDTLWSPMLSFEQRIDKQMALLMQHDLQKSVPLKERLRRIVQHVVLGRRWPLIGASEFLRKAVRRHELFWVRPLE